MEETNLNLVEGTNIELVKTGDNVAINCTYDDSELAGRVTDLEDGMSNYALVTETGNKLVINLNSSTYTMTIGLYDKNNTLISTSNEIDLPIESLIVSITYDSSTNELVITYKNGSVVRVPIGAIITGVEMQSNKVTSVSGSSTNTQYPSAKLLYDSLLLKEDKSNLVTSVSSSSTDTQYPSAKLLYDIKTSLEGTIGDIDEAVDLINGEVIS